MPPFNPNPCAVEECATRADGGRGWCKKHYKRWRKYGDPSVVHKLARGPERCSVRDCEKPFKANGYCSTHNYRARRGLPLDAPIATSQAGVPLPSCSAPGCEQQAWWRSAAHCPMHTQRLRRYGSLDDPKRFRKDGKGWLNSEGYRIRQINGRVIAEHRLVIERHIGRLLWPDETVHHVNGVRDDNRLENLELWSKSQPAGQRVEDKVAWAKELLRRYEPSALTEAVADVEAA